MNKNIYEILKKIDKDHYSLLIDIGKVSAELGLKSYLVGGMVRDLLLGFDNLDIDIVVENNAKQLAEALVKKFPNCELAVKHDRFHTAKVIFNVNGKKIPIDLASTREETYEHPAALPAVSVSELKKDLYRRDFTINALAVSLSPSDFGEVVDLFDGLIDLKNKKIKILHKLSFIDDPTRMIRAIRFACKLDFTIEENTNKLLKEAIESKQFDNLIEKIRGDRVKIEIRYLFNLPNIEEAVKEFFDSGIYRMVSVDLQSCRDVVHNVSTSGDTSRQWLIYLAIVIKDLKSDVQEKTMQNLQLTGDEIKIIKDGFNVFNKLKDKQSLDSIIIYRELRNLSIESIAIVQMLIGVEMPQRGVSTFIDEYLDKTSKIKLEITGQDLITMGVKEGKMIGEILEKVLETKIKDPDIDEVAEAKKLIL